MNAAEPRHCAFELRSVCSSCEETLPVNGIFEEVDCARCGASNDLGRRGVLQFLRAFEERHLEMEPDKQELNNRVGTDVRNWRVHYCMTEPACSECGRPIVVGATPAGGPEWLTCSCGEQVVVSRPPPWLEQALPTAMLCVGADPPEGEPERPTGAAPRVRGGSEGAILMACPECDGSLSIGNETRRDHRCEHCGGTVHLPTVLWRRLHPLPTMRRWYVRFEGHSLAMEKAEEDQREKEERQAEERRENRRERLIIMAKAVPISLGLLIFGGGLCYEGNLLVGGAFLLGGVGALVTGLVLQKMVD